MSAEGHLNVREMRLGEVDVRISYFHGATDEHLQRIGVDRASLPTPADWRATYEQDYARPVEERHVYSLIWELDGETVGFSSADRIVFGQDAFMHLHVLEDDQRRHGLGVEFVKKSARIYFEVLHLERLFCEPNALNTAPNRTMQRAGFEFQFSHHTTPTPINFPQVVTRWVLNRPPP